MEKVLIELTVLIPTNNLSMNTINTAKSINFDDVIYEILVVIDSFAEINFDSLDKIKLIKTVRVIHSYGERGIAETLNHGILSSRGKFILRIDDGDLNSRSDLSEELELLKNFDLVCAPMVSKDNKTAKLITPLLIYRTGRLSPFSRVPHPTWVFKKNCVKFLYQSRDHRCEDFGFIVRNKLNVGYVDKVAIEYDALNKLNLLSELKSVWCKWKVCFDNYKLHWIMVECTMYVLVRAARLLVTTKKVL